MSAVGSETVVVSSDAVILTREQAQYAMQVVGTAGVITGGSPDTEAFVAAIREQVRS